MYPIVKPFLILCHTSTYLMVNLKDGSEKHLNCFKTILKFKKICSKDYFVLNKVRKNYFGKNYFG